MRAKLQAYKNILGCCLSFIPCYGAYTGMINLQSSINSDEGLGLASSATLYSFTFFTTLMMPAVLKSLGTKYSLPIGYGLYLVYIISNYYTRWYTLIPGAVFGGLGNGFVWVSIQVHITNTACLYASSLNKQPSNFIGLFLGFFAFSIKSAMSFGGLMSSVALITFKPVVINITDEETLLLSNISDTSCTNTDAQYTEQDILYYILVSLYCLVVILGIFLELSLLDNYSSDLKFMTICNEKNLVNYFIQPLKDMLKLLVNLKMILIAPMCLLNGLTLAYFLGSFSNVYTSECIGVKWVGFTLITFGVFSGILSLIIGRLYKYIHISITLYATTFVALSTCLFLMFWERTPSLMAIFLLTIAWGGIDGGWNTIASSDNFADQQGPAFSIYQLVLSIGFTVNFLLPIFLETISILTIYTVVTVIGTITVTIMLCLHRLQSSKCKRNAIKETDTVVYNMNTFREETDDVDTVNTSNQEADFNNTDFNMHNTSQEISQS